MWSRSEIKESAKAKLKTSYWMPFLASLVIALAAGGIGNGSRYTVNHENWGFTTSNPLVFLPILLFGLVFIVIGIAVVVFLFSPLEMGARKFYIEYLKNNEDLSVIAFPFKSKSYFNIVKVLFSTKLTIFLWTLLLIIPGVIKAYQYKFVSYILAENADLSTSEALDMSTEMTRGHKMDLFVMDLSFIGWYILGSLFFGIGVFFVNPYRDTSFAMLYMKLSENTVTHTHLSYDPEVR